MDKAQELADIVYTAIRPFIYRRETEQFITDTIRIALAPHIKTEKDDEKLAMWGEMARKIREWSSIIIQEYGDLEEEDMKILREMAGITRLDAIDNQAKREAKDEH